ncbi:unnamed protein product [Polarella glacialis]|uniref:Reverse transcriptase domain-containing protein n=1 Tax=Polarella glacialis TaxID=89957 RepID=A0A813FX18_POLGL|nr:unnamed protein product [Polarella glacialis]
MRYADDLMIYAKSWQELCHMIELLCEELANIGLHLNTSKTKLFTTTSIDKPLFIDIAGGMVEVLTGTDFHKYLGRHLTGNLGIRSTAEFAHRVQCAWGKFHKHRPALMNKRVSIKLRLELFQSVVSPCVLFGLASLPLTSSQLRQLDSLQRRMLRSIAGWTRCDSESWSATMSRVNQRVDDAVRLFPVAPWSRQLATRQYHLAIRVAACCESWPAKAVCWHPQSNLDHNNTQHQPFRSRGRPRRKWDDFLTAFARNAFPHHATWVEAAKDKRNWLANESAFVDFFAGSES